MVSSNFRLAASVAGDDLIVCDMVLQIELTRATQWRRLD